MSVTSIPDPVKFRLWGKAGGRCQYEGCAEALWKDNLTQAEFNTAYIAHIIADKPDGPRGHLELSEKLKADPDNLMLMCDVHHRLIDMIDVQGHSVERLRSMKARHEERIELLTSLQEDKKSHVLLYGANIGEQNGSLSWKKAATAMFPHRFPAESRGIQLSLGNSSIQDHDPEFWTIEQRNLRLQFLKKVAPRISGAGDIEHLSIFALAPIPLLIQLGSLLSDIPAAEIYQLHREPPDWRWRDSPDSFEYQSESPAECNKIVALNLSLSATIDNSRITDTLGLKDLSIWKLTIENPNNDFLQSKDQLRVFRKEFRWLLNQIKDRHGQDAILHIFPAVPNSVAIEIGRVWMPKADLRLCIYDQNRKLGGFVRTLDFPEIC